MRRVGCSGAARELAMHGKALIVTVAAVSVLSAQASAELRVRATLKWAAPGPSEVRFQTRNGQNDVVWPRQPRTAPPLALSEPADPAHRPAIVISYSQLGFRYTIRALPRPGNRSFPLELGTLRPMQCNDEQFAQVGRLERQGDLDSLLQANLQARYLRSLAGNGECPEGYKSRLREIEQRTACRMAWESGFYDVPEEYTDAGSVECRNRVRRAYAETLGREARTMRVAGSTRESRSRVAALGAMIDDEELGSAFVELGSLGEDVRHWRLEDLYGIVLEESDPATAAQAAEQLNTLANRPEYQTALRAAELSTDVTSSLYSRALGRAIEQRRDLQFRPWVAPQRDLFDPTQPAVEDQVPPQTPDGTGR